VYNRKVRRFAMIVTFDFDNTLTVTQFDPDDGWFTKDAGPNRVMLQSLIAHVENGNDVHIVTSRKETPESREEIEKFLNKNKVFDKVSGVHFTFPELKAGKLAELGSLRHHDDDEEEIAHLPEDCEGILVKNGHRDVDGNICDPMEDRFRME
jgi:FMN phosphatase YigB (HAD superfamily)